MGRQLSKGTIAICLGANRDVEPMTQRDFNVSNAPCTGPPIVQPGDGTLVSPSPSLGQPLVTIFSLPKPFGRDTDLIQRNAINSWKQLCPEVDVLLIGDENGIAETAKELDVRHAGGIDFNQHGTPLLSSAFEIAHRQSKAPFLAYCNCDVILMKDFPRAIERLAQDRLLNQFVAFGQRVDLKIDQPVDFEQRTQVDALQDDCRQRGTRCSNVCKEYFVFNRELYREVPPFAVGRGNWDNWMIHSAKLRQVPVVKVSELVTAIHQSHDYSHTSAGRFQCYVSGEEAEENRRLAGGRHIISGSTANWRMTPAGLKRERPLLINAGFWSDVPRFARLLLNLVSG